MSSSRVFKASCSGLPWKAGVQLIALQPSLQIAADCWNLLSAPDGNSRRQVYLPQGEREPQGAYERRFAAARPSGFFRDALRTYAGMLSRGSWLNLPPTRASVLTDVDGRGTNLGVFLAWADLLVLRDGAALVLVLLPEHSWPSEGDRQKALRRGDRLSLPRLQLVPRTDALNWELPSSQGLSGRIHWQEPQHQGIQPVEPGTGAAVREQIAPLLGDSDAPDRWSYQSLRLTEAESQATGMEVCLHPVTADPTGWRCDPPTSTRYPGLTRLPACWYTSDGSAFGDGDLPHLGLAYQYLTL